MECDDEKRLAFGMLDSEPLNNYDGQIGLGSELAVVQPVSNSCYAATAKRDMQRVVNAVGGESFRL